MCGIAGLVSLGRPLGHSDKLVVQDMMETLRSRGPDGAGILTAPDHSAIFGQRLLSIVGVGTNAQPIARSVRGRFYLLTFSGEIYNYREVKAELIRRGHTFTTLSDTEVVLVAYAEWGAECLQRFNGDFAIAIFDESKKQLFLTRDRVGVKPLFYWLGPNGELAFASEPKAILKHPSVLCRPDLGTIADFFLHKDFLTNATSLPDRSFYEGVKSLPPGTYGIFSGGDLTVSSYWELPFGDRSQESEERLTEKLFASITAAIDIRVPQEAAFGTFLSGGVDSAIINARLRQKGLSFPAATINFELGSNTDFTYAAHLARELGIQLIAPPLSPRFLLEQLEEMIRCLDEPHDTSRQLGLFACYGLLASSRCKVALVGEGSDEFNLGYYFSYPGFERDLNSCNSADALFEAASRRAPFATGLLAPSIRAEVDWDSVIWHDIEQNYLACSSSDPVDRMQFYYARRFLKYRLDANDRCGMAHSVEARVPYCDHNVIADCLSVPIGLNIGNGLEKRILRQAFHATLPEQFLYRPKFPIPENDSLMMHSAVSDLLEQRIAGAPSSVWDLLSKKEASRLSLQYQRLVRGAAANTSAAVKLAELGQPASLTDAPTMQAKHPFALLTFIVWFEQNFG